MGFVNRICSIIFWKASLASLRPKGAEISVDDVIIHGVTMEELVSRLSKVFERCCTNNLRLNHEKCKFGVTEISVLGHVVSAAGIKLDPKCEAIKNTSSPKNV